MKVLGHIYITSRREEIETIPSFLASESNAREIAEVIFATTDVAESSDRVALPFAIIINIYRLSPVYIKAKKEKVLVGYKYRFRQQLYIAPVISNEVPNIPRYLLEYIQGLEEFLIPPQ